MTEETITLADRVALIAKMILSKPQGLHRCGHGVREKDRVNPLNDVSRHVEEIHFVLQGNQGSPRPVIHADLKWLRENITP